MVWFSAPATPRTIQATTNARRRCNAFTVKAYPIGRGIEPCSGGELRATASGVGEHGVDVCDELGDRSPEARVVDRGDVEGAARPAGDARVEVTGILARG